MKFTLVLIAACMAFQATSASSTLREDSDLVKFVKGAFQKFVDFDEKAYAKVESFLSSYTANPEAKNQELVDLIDNIGYNVTKAIVEEIKKLLVDIEPLVSENGKKAITCIRQEEEKVYPAVNSSVKVIASCLLTPVPTLVADADDVRKLLSVAIAIFKDADQKLQDCTFGELCLVQLFGNLTPLKDQVQPFIDAAKKVIDGVKAALPDEKVCFTNQKDNILKIVVDIFNDAINCIDA